MDKPSDTLRFDGWTLDKASGDLTKDGVTTRLEIRPLLALLELIEHRGEVVTREQLYTRLWPKGVVEFDSSLNTAMRKVRLALKDEHDKPRYIETIQRRGYRFLAQLDPVPVTPDVEVAPPPGPLPTRRLRPWYLLGGLCLAVAIVAATLLYFRQADTGATPALAVLPFVAVSGPDDTALSLGITEELSNRLSQLTSIKVVARTSASQFAGKNAGAREIGLALGVTHLVEGTVGRDKDVIRVSVKLVSADTGFDLYTQSFEFPRGAELDIERSLVQAVVTALRVRLSPEVARRWEARDSRSRLAFDYYVRARQYGHQHTPDGNDQSAALYRLAIEQDPQFALAYVGLAESLLSSVSERGVRIAEISDEISRLLNTAEKINSQLPELLAARGWLASELGDYAAAETHLHAALALNPSDAVSSARLGNVYDALGQPRDALENYTRAAELDPLDFLPQLYRCLELQELGRFDEAERACAQTRALAPGNYWGPFATSLLKSGRGDLPEAIYWSNEASKLEPSQSGVANFRIELLLTLGLPEKARESAAALTTTDEVQTWRINANLALLEHGEAGLRSFLERGGELEFTDMDGLVDVARFQHTVGNLAEARKALQKAFELPGFSERELVKPEQILAGYSPAVICAGLLLATGERDHALQLLGDLDEMLDRMERNGWANHGLYSLRAESLALRGQGDAAMQSLNRAVARGWRQAWRAQVEPYLASLRGREDFKALIKDVEARNASMRARYLKTVTVTAQ
jgi:TolB-like protein/DNA-binding winged helix-turn-helix (wHTH) protein/tetratricopeptide (TPR) repeat protein